MDSDASNNEKDLELLQLRDRNRLLNMILDAVPYSIFAKDLEGRYLVANQAMANYFGMEKDEIPTRTIDENGAGTDGHGNPGH